MMKYLTFIILISFLFLTGKTQAQCQARFTYIYNPALSQPEQDIYLFSDSSTGEDSSTHYNWSFGTGDFSSLQNPSFTYEPDDSGAEQVCLDITNYDSTCTSQYCQTLQVQNLCIGARYSYEQSGNTVTLHAAICGTWDAIHWDFGDGTTDDHGDTLIAHTFPMAVDSYTICMQVAISAECQYLYPCTGIYCQQIHIYPTSIGQIPTTPSGLSIYPNPTSQNIQIATSSCSFPAELFLSDITGQIINHFTLVSQTQQIVLGDLSPGVYFIQLRDQQNQRAVAKFLKQ